MNFEKEYNDVMKVIEEIPDEYEQTPYKERAAKKYKSLDKEQKREEAEKQMKIDAEDAANKADTTLKKNRIKKAQWYIDELNGRDYYTDVTKELIRDGKKALKRVKGYSEYDGMKAAFDAAVMRAKSLPTEPETPEIPEGPADKRPVDPDDYEDEPTATPAATPTSMPQ